MTRRALGFCLAGLIWVTGCPGLGPGVTLAVDDPRALEALSRLRHQQENRTSLKGELRLAVDGPRGSLRSKQAMVLQRPARLRVEIQGFLNQTVAVLVTDGQTYELFRVKERSFEAGAVPPGLLQEIAQVDLTPEEAVEILLGGQVPDESRRLSEVTLLPDGGLSLLFADRSSGETHRHLEFDDQGRLRSLRAFGPDGETLWVAVLGDHRDLKGGSFAHQVDLDFHVTGTRVKLQFKNPVLNPDPGPEAFELHIPGVTAISGTPRG